MIVGTIIVIAFIFMACYRDNYKYLLGVLPGFVFLIGSLIFSVEVNTNQNAEVHLVGNIPVIRVDGEIWRVHEHTNEYLKPGDVIELWRKVSWDGIPSPRFIKIKKSHEKDTNEN